MTDRTEVTMYEEYAATREGRRELAAANLAIRVSDVLRSAFERSGCSNSEFAKALGVSDGRASQILNSDGNLRVSTIAKALDALGWAAAITAEKDGVSLPAPRRSRRQAAPKKSDWDTPRSCSFEVRMISNEGVGTHSFNVHHTDENDPVMLETPRLVRASKSSLHMETTIETEVTSRDVVTVRRVKV